MAYYLEKIPELMAVFIISLLSGHIWSFMFYLYSRHGKKGGKYINSIHGKLAIGLTWNAIFATIAYFLKYGFNTDAGQKILSIIYFILVVAMAVQGVVVLLFLKIKK